MQSVGFRDRGEFGFGYWGVRLGSRVRVLTSVSCVTAEAVGGLTRLTCLDFYQNDLKNAKGLQGEARNPKP